MSEIIKSQNILHTQRIKPNIVVVGSINCDLTTYVANFPKLNETVMAKHAALTLGGKGLNQAVAAARAGGSVTMVACVGDDHFGALAVKYLNANSVNTTHVHSASACATGTATILVDENANNMIVVAPGANAALTVAHVQAAESVIAEADMVIVQMEVPLESVMAALKMAEKYSVPTILNPAPASMDVLELLPLARIFTPNETEMELLSGIYPNSHESIAEGVDKLRALGAEIVIITKGSEGCSIACDDNFTHINAYKVAAVDPTGAGDVFNGVLAVAIIAASKLCDGVFDAQVIEHAVRQASAAATLSVTKQSAEGAAPLAAEIERFLAMHVEQNLTAPSYSECKTYNKNLI